MRCVFGLLSLVLLLSAAGIAGGAPDAEGESWFGILPDPAAPADADHFVCRVLDARTGAPIQGARWIRTPEWIAPGRLRHDVPLGVATTDALGIAYLPTTPDAWTYDCHWLVVADGYGFAYEYGAVPEVEVRLEPETTVRGRVVDALGRPVPGALIEALGGCSHGTAAATAVADDLGAFVLHGIDASLPGQLWVAGKGIASDLIALSSPESLGSRGVLLAMATGVRYQGRVVDLLGEPLERTVVRVYNEQRGPAVTTGPDGSFVLEGAEPDADLMLYPAADLTEGEAAWHVGDARPERACVLALSPVGVVEAEEAATLRIRARDRQGTPVPGLEYAVLSDATGRGPWGVTADVAEDGLEIGEAAEGVGPGPWHVVPTDPWSTHTFDAVPVADPSGVVELVARPQPRLRIAGPVPDEALLTVAIPGASLESLDAAEDAVHVPAGVEAALRVEIEGRPPFFFPVGAVVHDERIVLVKLPDLHGLVLPKGARDARLFDGGRDVYQVQAKQPGTLLTDATGPVTLRYDDADGVTWEVDVVVPESPRARELVSAANARRVPPEAYDEDEERPADGPCTLRIHVRDEDGPVDATVLVGDGLHRAPQGAVEVSGLPVGGIVVTVARRDVVGEGRRFRLDLVEGEPRRLRAILPLD